MSIGHDATRRPINDGEAVTAQMLGDIGRAAQASAFDAVLAALIGNCSGTALVVPDGGFIGGRSFHPKRTAALKTTIEPGVGLYNREDLGGIDPTDPGYEFSPMLVPFFLRTATELTHDAHHATNPRWDLISVIPAADTDLPAGVRVRTAGPGSQAVQTLDTRETWAPTFTITKGTPAGSPTVPSTPAGALAIAKVYVPATSGNITVYDIRTQVDLGYGLRDTPRYPRYGYPVQESGLAVSAGSGMTVDVTAGYAGLGSTRRYYEAVTLDAPSSIVDPVKHLVYSDDTGVHLLQGTPGASPAEPSTPAGAVPLAIVSLLAGAASISSGDIEDLTVRGPYQGAMADIPIAFLKPTLAAESGDARVLTLQAVDWSGNALAVPVTFELHVGAHNDGPEPADSGTGAFAGTVTTGTEVRAFSSDGSGIITTNASGTAVISILSLSTLTVYLTAQPITYLDASSAAAASGRQRYRPGGPTVIKASWA